MLKTGGRFFCLEFSHDALAGLRRRSTTPIRASVVPQDRQGGGEGRGQLSLSDRIDPSASPTWPAFARMIGAAGFGKVKVEPILGGLVAIHSGWKI